MVFGKDDPWCKPAFAKKMLQALDTRQPDAIHRYVELSNVGHCPNHEAPKATAMVLNDWWSLEEKERSLGGAFSIREAWGETTVQERAHTEIPLTLVDRLAVTFV